jgi:hypothetical protein
MQNQGGYIAVASMLVIGVVVLVVGTTVSLLAINDIQSALADKKGHEALDLVEGCAEDALLMLNENNSLPSTVVLPEGSCSVTINSQSGSTWIFTVSGTFEGYVKSIQVEAERSTTIVIRNWSEQ